MIEPYLNTDIRDDNEIFFRFIRKPVQQMRVWSCSDSKPTFTKIYHCDVFSLTHNKQRILVLSKAYEQILEEKDLLSSTWCATQNRSYLSNTFYMQEKVPKYKIYKEFSLPQMEIDNLLGMPVNFPEDMTKTVQPFVYISEKENNKFGVTTISSLAELTNIYDNLMKDYNIRKVPWRNTSTKLVQSLSETSKEKEPVVRKLQFD